MQVTCPNCRARYAVDPLAIGPSGRTVQCARCSERWFQLVKIEPPPEPAPAAADPTVKPKPGAKRLMPWFLSKPAAAKDEPDDDSDKDGDDDRDPTTAPGGIAATSRLARPGLLKWLPFARGPRKPPPERKPRRDPDVETRPDRDSDRPHEDKPAVNRIDTAPVPDVVIRPPMRGSALPALIEPKVERGLSLVLVGALMLLLLLAAAVLAFHNVIADQLPMEWRSILRFDA